MITNESIQRLKESISILDLISSHIQVQKSGANYMCVCPFHADKNPSMAIRDDEGFFHCFGCGEHGDAISFMQKYHNLDFLDAVKELANRYNFILDDDKKTPARANNAALERLNEYYINELNYKADLIGYLEKRKITRDLRIKFNLGYAPSSNDTLRVLERSGVMLSEALALGAVKKNDNGVYASFIERITFPIYDYTGFLVGFGGRTLNPNNPAKYVNSPASKIFDKSQIFYGYHLAKSEINKHKKIIICEGYMDTISLHKAGLGYAVAVLGTALTKQHLRLIKKDCFVMLCFDKDKAGLNAAFKAASLLSANNYNAEVMRLKSYKDPGEYIENNAEEQLKSELLNGQNIISFCIEYIFKNELGIEYIDAHALSKIQPFLIKQAYQKVLAYTATIDKFLASTHLARFCKSYGLDFELLNDSKIIAQTPAPQSKENLKESRIIHFLAKSRANFSVLIMREYFSNPLIDTVLAGDYSNFELIEFLENFNDFDKVKNILYFFSNLAEYYASFNILNARFFTVFSSVIKKNQQLIKSEDGLKRAYHCLVELIIHHNTHLSPELAQQLNTQIRGLEIESTGII